MTVSSALARLTGGRIGHLPPIVSVVRLTGIIGGIGPLRRGLTLTGLAATLERAFRMRGLSAVALTINSPGGSAVQSALIGRRIRALAAEHGVPVIAFAEEVAASGGYWLACAADEIFADESSVVGSIGVIAGSFGFPDLLERAGVERRVHTAGEHKAALDPFRPERDEDVQHLHGFLEDVHATFREHVRARRAGKLAAPEDELFSGRWWSGRRALELGLVDGIGDVRSIMRARFGEDVRLRVVGPRPGWWRRRMTPSTFAGGERAWAGDLAGELLAAVEERLMWSRFGL